VLNDYVLLPTLILLVFSTGIGPEAFAFISSDGSFTGGDPITEDQQTFYEEHGYYITASDYIMRPEGTN
jgi:mannosyl-oligosaccharide alpha-1,2-mannosidase